MREQRLMLVLLTGAVPVLDPRAMPHVKAWGLYPVVNNADEDAIDILYCEGPGDMARYAGPTSLYGAETAHLKPIEPGDTTVPDAVWVELARRALLPEPVSHD